MIGVPLNAFIFIRAMERIQKFTSIFSSEDFMKININETQRICDITLIEAWDSTTNTTNILKFLKEHLNKSDIFFEFYRANGDDIQEDCTKIFNYFNLNGNLETVNLRGNKLLSDIRYNAIGRLPSNLETLKLIPFLCDCYLETLIFSPNQSFSWEAYSQYFYHNAIERKVEYFLQEGYADILFYKSDDSNFNIAFNKSKYELYYFLDHLKNALGSTLHYEHLY